MTRQGCKGFRNLINVKLMKSQYLSLKRISFVLKAAAVMLRDEASGRSDSKEWQFTFKPGAMLWWMLSMLRASA
jgi:hypothetical protein